MKLINSTLNTGKTNFLLLILLVLFSCPNSNSDITSNTPNTPSATTLPSIDYGISEDFYISLIKTNILLEQKVNLGRQVNFYINPSLPSGLVLNITNGTIKGTTTTVSLPTSYTVTAISDGKNFISKIISLGVAPVQVWVTNTNSAKPYELTAYVVGDRTQQTGVSWSSSDTSLATVSNNGVVDIKTSPIGGTVEITATKNGNSGKVAFSVTTTPIDYGASDFYIVPINTPVNLTQSMKFNSTIFSITPTLPNGLTLDTTSGNISGTPTVVAIPSEYTILAKAGGKSQTNIITLGVAPSQVWVTNTNSAKLYELTAYVIGDRTKQTGISWSSSDTSLATVNNNGVVDIKTPLIGGTVEITAIKDGNSDKVTFNVPGVSIDYGTSNFYIAHVNTQIDLIQSSPFNNTVFSVNPALPNGLTLDTTSGNISGIPTVVMLPSQYTITATVGGKSQTEIISLGVAPSQVWVTNTNSAKLYELTSYVVGDRTKQTGISWSSSDIFLATVNNNGVVDIKTSLTGGNVEIIATTTDGKTGKVTFNVPSTSIDYGLKDLYIALLNNQIDLSQNSVFKNTVFSVNPVLPNGLTLDTTSGSISGIPTVVMIPNEYTVTATVGGRSQTKIISLGVAPSQVWVTNANPDRLYELTAYVVGDRTKQTGISWSSSDTSLATVNNNGVISFIATPTGNTLEITATTTDGNSDKITFNINSIRNVIDGQIITENGIADLVINSGVTAITGTQFKNQGFNKVTIPDSVTTIGKGTLSFNKLTSVVIPDSVTYIGIEAFWNNQLTSVVIPDSVTNIDNNAFYQNQLTSVTIPNSVTYIGDNAFYQNQLTSVTIPNSVTNVGVGAFSYNQLTTVVIPNSLTRIEQGVFWENQLTTVVIPDSVTYIGLYAFNNNKLTNVVIPDRVTYIGQYAFNNNKLTTVVIPDSVTNIDNNAFADNPNLVEVSLSQSLYNSLGSSRNTIFGAQVTSYIRRP